MKKQIVILALTCLIFNLCYAQVVEKEVLEADGTKHNITATSTGMYDGTESAKALEYYKKAFDYAHSKDYKNAEKYYLKTIKEDPSFVEAYDNLGRIYRVTGKLDKAEEYYKKSSELYPDGIMAHQNLAVVYGLQKRHEETIVEYEEILRISKDNPEGYFGLANTYMVLSKFDKALENAKKALEIYKATDSHHINDGYYLVGLISYYSGNVEDARKYCTLAKEHGTQLDPKLEQVLFSNNEYADIQLEEKEDYKKSEDVFLESYDWLLKTPVNEDPAKRKNANAFLLTWLSGSPYVTIEVGEKVITTFEDCPDCLMIFLGSWSKYTIETKKYSGEKAKLTAVNEVLSFYEKNKAALGKSKELEKLKKLKAKNKLKTYLKENF